MSEYTTRSSYAYAPPYPSESLYTPLAHDPSIIPSVKHSMGSLMRTGVSKGPELVQRGLTTGPITRKPVGVEKSKKIGWVMWCIHYLSMLGLSFFYKSFSPEHFGFIHVYSKTKMEESKPQ